jgi:hypothetical protein|tara:strand:- start:2982 stop:3416 length:435 start_codon:yes stop_codon:yes gene_type:complete
MLYDRNPIDNKVFDYRQPHNGVWQSDKLSQHFYCKKNVEHIKKTIKEQVVNITRKNYNITDEDIQNIQLLMRNTFILNAKDIHNNIEEQIKRFNDTVVKSSVKKIIDGINAYIKYRYDIGNLALPQERPVATYQPKTLEFKNFF